MQNGRVGFDSTLYHPSNFGIGFDNPTKNIIEPSALIEMQADDKGLLIPRMTADQMTAIAQPANSLLVYNTTDSVFNYYDEKTDEWKDLSKGDIWLTNDYFNNGKVFLSKYYRFVGIGTEEPQVKLHIFAETDDINFEVPPPTIRIENNYKNKYSAWDIQSDKEYFKIKYGQNNNSQVQKTETKFVFTDETYFGIGTDKPQANLHISNRSSKINAYKSNIILESYNKEPIYFEISNSNGKINFDFTNEETTQTILNFNPNSQKLNLLNENCTIDNQGTVTATKFVGEFEGITGYWQENNDGINYNGGNVGIGTDEPVEKFQIGDRWTFHNGGTKVIGYNFDYQNNGAYRIVDGYVSQIRFSQNGNIEFRVAENGAAGTQINSNTVLSIRNDGNVSIENQLWVKQDIWIQSFEPDWGDFVFEPDYELIPLLELQEYITQNKHLPDVPSANEIEEDGFKLAEMDALQMMKIEELTLYILQLQKQILEMQKEIDNIKNEEE